MLRSGTRLADSSAPELILAALALAVGLGELAGVVPLIGRTRDSGLTAPLVWYALADVPFVQFMLWRSLWRWVIWVWVLIGLARIELDLVPSHPDRRGGINFLRWPSIGYCSMLVFAISSMLCASQVTRFTAAGVTLTYLRAAAAGVRCGGDVDRVRAAAVVLAPADQRPDASVSSSTGAWAPSTAAAFSAAGSRSIGRAPKSGRGRRSRYRIWRSRTATRSIGFASCCSTSAT